MLRWIHDPFCSSQPVHHRKKPRRDNMATPGTVLPGHALGQLCLGASLHDVLSLIKEDKQTYPAIDLHHSQTDPLGTPVVVGLPANGVRLRFDGADQRLRLIEILDFMKIKLVYKGSELVKGTEDGLAAGGPAFKRVYSLFGPSYPGEYIPPRNKRDSYGTYVLSWPGVAFNFPLQHAAWSREKDHVSLLGSHVAGAATHMALFEGKSWPEARKDLFVREPEGPRLSALANRAKDSLPEEIDFANILGDGRIELVRSTGNSPFVITLNQTTPQDLTTELGPPHAVHKREEPPGTPEPTTQHRRAASSSRPLSNGRSHPGSQPSSYSSTGTDTFDTDFDPGEAEDDPAERASRERFWCYFSTGLDILVGPPSEHHATSHTTTTETTPHSHLTTSHHLVVTRVVIHGNVPGSYAFNRHRRLRWSLALPPSTATPKQTDHHLPLLLSEHNFDTVMKPALLSSFAQTPGYSEPEMAKGKVVNRTWSGSGGGIGGSGSESGFFLPDEEQEVGGEGGMSGGGLGDGLGDGSESWLGNTKLYSFPGLVVEVLGNGAVGGLTVY
ncbi:hypothetical protein D0869_04587 [Hortaea werneckii]|uniref:Uncharacterized protein n=2 Tax=Hortaea werneckii TaxID=91943 RepID=A0A3M6X0I7_HORWE|nr:hypothetical protein D0869_04587 [Hortaea werneckii]